MKETYHISKTFSATQIVYIVTPVSRHPEGEHLLRQNSSTGDLDNHKRMADGNNSMRIKDSHPRIDEEMKHISSSKNKTAGIIEKKGSFKRGGRR